MSKGERKKCGKHIVNKKVALGGIYSFKRNVTKENFEGIMLSEISQTRANI